MLSENEYVELTKQWPTQTDCVAFYGNPRSRGFEDAHIVSVPCPWRLVYEGKPVRNNSIRVNRKCSDSLLRVLNVVWNVVHQDQAVIEALHYHLYSGSFVVRPIRGKSSKFLSMHAYGAAIDWDDRDNPHHSSKHLFTGASPLIEAFKREGWIWGGDWKLKSVDAMHVQAARVY